MTFSHKNRDNREENNRNKVLRAGKWVDEC